MNASRIPNLRILIGGAVRGAIGGKRRFRGKLWALERVLGGKRKGDECMWSTLTEKMKKGLCVSVVAGLALAGAGYAADKDTLIIANTADAITLDVTQIRDNQSGNVRLQTHDGLLVIDEKGELQPVLAERWEQPDALTYVFYLKKGIKFHNGEELKAEDVKFSMERAMGPLGVAIHSLIRELDKVNVIDDYTVEFKLKKPFTPFLYSLGESWAGILNKKASEEKDPALHPVGTGPFKFVSWTKGDKIVLERYDDYHGQKASVKNLIIRAIPEAASRMVELESGAVDIAYQITAENDIKRVEASPKLYLSRVASNRCGYIGMNTQRAPFDDVRFRHAVLAALNVPAIQKTVWRGVGMPGTTPIPPLNKYYDETVTLPEQDVERAKALLKETGVKLPIQISLWTNEARERVDAATIIQNMLAEVDIEVDIRVMEWGAFLEGLKASQHDMFMLGWGGNLPDAEFFLGSNYHSSSIGSTNNSRYNSPEFDALIEKGTSVPDGPERKAVYSDVQKLFVKDLPAIYWSVEESVVGLNNRVKNFQNHPKGFYQMNVVTIEE